MYRYNDLNAANYRHGSTLEDLFLADAPLCTDRCTSPVQAAPPHLSLTCTSPTPPCAPTGDATHSPYTLSC